MHNQRMLIRNSLNLLKELSSIEEQIELMREFLGDDSVDEERLLKLVLLKNLDSSNQ